MGIFTEAADRLVNSAIKGPPTMEPPKVSLDEAQLRAGAKKTFDPALKPSAQRLLQQVEKLETHHPELADKIRFGMPEDYAGFVASLGPGAAGEGAKHFEEEIGRHSRELTDMRAALTKDAKPESRGQYVFPTEEQMKQVASSKLADQYRTQAKTLVDDFRQWLWSQPEGTSVDKVKRMAESVLSAVRAKNGPDSTPYGLRSGSVWRSSHAPLEDAENAADAKTLENLKANLTERSLLRFQSESYVLPTDDFGLLPIRGNRG
jgi:hypothetical protein